LGKADDGHLCENRALDLQKLSYKILIKFVRHLAEVKKHFAQMCWTWER
jgi:hypothetical protein